MRLIDADALKANCDITIGDTTIGRRDYVMFHEIDNAPTIEAVPKDFHDKTCEAMAKRHTEEIQRLMWIPCSERLPSKGGRYLVTFPTLINKPWIDILWHGRPTFPETDHPCFYASDDEYGDVEYDDVVAWMPLPEPYREREGE